MAFKYSMEPSQSSISSVKLLPFSPEVLKKDKDLLQQLAELWMQLDATEAKYDEKFGLFFNEMPNPTEEFKKILLHHSGYYLRLDDKAIGFTVVMDSEYKNAYWLSTLIVDSKYRGMGLGRMLIEQIFDKKKPKRAILRVSINNPAGLALYKKCGFEPISQIMVKSK